MPLYTYKCPHCEQSVTLFKKLAELDREELCSSCGRGMVRQLSAPAVVADYAGYACPITGDWVEGRRAHEENLKKHGCRVYEAGETEAVRRHRAQEERALDAAVDDSVEKFITTLPTRKREKLFEEVQQGATVSVDRN